MARKILIGTPCYDGRIDVNFSHALRSTERKAKDIDFTPVYMSYDSLVQRARNDLVQITLEGGFDELFFIDSDMKWEADWAIQLLSHDVDVVGATYRKKTDKEELYTIRTAFPIPVDLKTGLWVVDGLGTGFLRIRRRALQALWDASEEYTNEGKTCRWIFDVLPFRGELMGEDMIACEKLRQLGFSIYLDPSFTPIHIGIKEYYGNIASYVEALKQQRKEAA